MPPPEDPRPEPATSATEAAPSTSPDEPAGASADVAAELDAVALALDDLREDVHRAAAAGARHERQLGELRAALDALLQILRVRETLEAGHLAMIDKLRRHVRDSNEPQLVLGSTPDKYQVELSQIDCDARMHLCHGRCCSYNIPLSEQDLVEGKVAWRIREPYLLAQRPNGTCVYQSEDTGACSNYEARPAPCRTYDCRYDPRVWLDFEARVPAPMPEGLVTLRRPGRAS
ncbi:MAG: YkgJ family cysteine cluster protein [Kofleriaceae bacterium]